MTDATTTQSADEQPLVKVVLVQEYEDGDESDVESPWALELGNDQYQLKNFPFFFYGLSYNDIFEARPSPEYPDDPRPYFVKLIKKSGHRTARVFMTASIQESEAAKQALDELKAMYCGYEGNGDNFFVINIQPHCDFEAVVKFLDDNEHIEAWEMADPVDEVDEEANESGS